MTPSETREKFLQDYARIGNSRDQWPQVAPRPRLRVRSSSVHAPALCYAFILWLLSPLVSPSFSFLSSSVLLLLYFLFTCTFLEERSVKNEICIY